MLAFLFRARARSSLLLSSLLFSSILLRNNYETCYPCYSMINLPSPKELKERLPLGKAEKTFIEDSRKTAHAIALGKEPRIVIIAGPCSIHDFESALEYAAQIKKLAERVSKSCFLVMRVYGEKPRTTTGWKGFLYDPHLDGSHDMAQGLYWTRELLLRLAKIGVAAATEFVDPLSAPYIEDLITWGFIGARTCTSQTHRQLASSLPFPVGFKNSLDGNIDHAMHGVKAASLPHSFLFVDETGKVAACQGKGNRAAHVVLRGSSERANYDPKSIAYALEGSSRVLVDCSHGNCQKDHLRQKEAFQSVIEQIAEGNRGIMGVMLESHLKEGNQFLSENPSSLRYAVSITDPCIDWPLTEELILSADVHLSPSLQQTDSSLSKKI